MSQTWKITSPNSNGFLPNTIPQTLEDNNIFEILANDLPNLIANNKVRTDLINELSVIDINNFNITKDNVERYFQILCYFASAYVHKGEPTNLLPKEISIFLVKLSKLVERPPILSYASYCLTNWRLIDFTKPIFADNIDLIQKFSNIRDETWFIVIHTEIEYIASQIVDEINKCFDDVNYIGDNFGNSLDIIAAWLEKINNVLARMPEQCSPDVYFKEVRPYIFGFNNLIYEDCFNNEPQTFRGETGAQSSIIPMLLISMGIKHKESMLTKHLEDMRNYMPKEHREFLTGLENITENFDLRSMAINSGQTEKYNKCLEQLIIFRKKHLEYAVEYIHKKVENPAGTGGTPYIPWLSELIRETEEFYI